MRNNNFALLRHLAAIGVLLRHSIHHLNINSGWIVDLNITKYLPGVSVFFIMSGFLLALTYNKNPNLQHYSKNRMVRIFPVLWISLFISVLTLYYFGFVEFNTKFFSWVLSQATIVQIYNIEMFRDFGVGVPNGSLWTIFVLLTFYILLPILFLIYRKSIWMIIVLFCVSFFFWIYDQTNSTTLFIDKLLHITIIPYLFIFIIGMGFYKYFNYLKKIFEDKFLFWLMIFIITEFVTDYLKYEPSILLYILRWILFSFMVFSFSFSFKHLSNLILKGKDYSYGIYIYHMLVINVFVQLDLYGEMKYFYYTILMTIFISILSWHFIEKPIVLWSKHKNSKN